MSGAASGVSGLEASHAWAELDLTPLLTLNVITDDPCFKLIELPGFWSTPDLDDNRHPKTGTFGEEVVTSFSRGKTFEYKGAVIGSTRDKCLIGKTALMAAFGPLVSNGSTPERRMVITPAAALVDAGDPAPSGDIHTYVAVCRKVDLGDSAPASIRDKGEQPKKWALPFTLEMRITDGLFYKWSGGVQSAPKYA